MSTTAPKPDPRVGLKAGQTDAGTAAWNLKLVSNTPPSEHFAGVTNSDMTFYSNYVIQGNYNGYQVWNVSNPVQPTLTDAFLCPASQSDVSVYKNLLFVSGEGLGGRVDCGTQGVQDTVSTERLRGLRIFDITDIANPKNVANVQTCRGSHTHTVVPDPKDAENVYVYISGSAPVRSPNELAGCISAPPDSNPNSSLFRIEVIKIPLANPQDAKVVSAPRIFDSLVAPPRHGETKEDQAAQAKAVAEAKAKGGFTANVNGTEMVLPNGFVNGMLDSVVKARGGSGAPTAADSAALREAIPGIVAKIVGPPPVPGVPRPGPTQCHDITVYSAIGLAGGACGGYGLLLDISDVVNPKRIYAVSDSNFSFWHSATFNNDGTKLLFSDEWGGGGQPRCRATDKYEWGADAIFTMKDRKLTFGSYYKMPAAQTQFENCVAHNGSLIPIPGRDIMVQAWYQGGISVFDWTDPAHPKEIAYFDRGPMDSTKMVGAGSWSAYWYNGYIYSSEIARGLDVFELTPSGLISKNEIEAAKSVKLDYLNVQDQPKLTWPASVSLTGAYLDQLERSKGLSDSKLSSIRKQLDEAEKLTGQARQDALSKLATQIDNDVAGAADQAKVRSVASSVRDLAASQSASR
ncbi:MAG TPA: hypothetical protein VH438_11475 [Gemmatimonadales bacterium]|jgi:hypothetical protein